MVQTVKNATELRAGIPLISDLKALQGQEVYAHHVEFNKRFLEIHRAAIERYGRQWGTDPFQLWSRRWEYPFAAERILAFAAEPGNQGKGLRILDAGSGVTYVPYLLCDEIPGAQVTCCDSNPKYDEIFAEVNRDHAARNGGKGSGVSFVKAMLQSLPFPDSSQDAVACISVLEHTDNYGEIINEFARVLRPGGLLVLTFDLSLDGKFNLSREKAADLIGKMGPKFESADGTDLVAMASTELAQINRVDEILSTGHVRRTEPQLLPWKHPFLKSMHDLLHGHGWTGGFRSKSIFCVSARAKAKT